MTPWPSTRARREVLERERDETARYLEALALPLGGRMASRPLWRPALICSFAVSSAVSVASWTNWSWSAALLLSERVLRSTYPRSSSRQIHTATPPAIAPTMKRSIVLLLFWRPLRSKRNATRSGEG